MNRHLRAPLRVLANMLLRQPTAPVAIVDAGTSLPVPVDGLWPKAGEEVPSQLVSARGFALFWFGQGLAPNEAAKSVAFGLPGPGLVTFDADLRPHVGEYSITSVSDPIDPGEIRSVDDHTIRLDQEMLANAWRLSPSGDDPAIVAVSAMYQAVAMSLLETGPAPWDATRSGLSPQDLDDLSAAFGLAVSEVVGQWLRLVAWLSAIVTPVLPIGPKSTLPASALQDATRAVDAYNALVGGRVRGPILACLKAFFAGTVGANSSVGLLAAPGSPNPCEGLFWLIGFLSNGGVFEEGVDGVEPAGAATADAPVVAPDNGARIAQEARSLIAEFKAKGVEYNQPKRAKPGFSDCSSFVQRVLETAGFPEFGLGSGSITAEGFVNSPRLAHVPLAEALPGDLVVQWFHSASDNKTVYHMGVVLGTTTTYKKRVGLLGASMDTRGKGNPNDHGVWGIPRTDGGWYEGSDTVKILRVGRRSQGRPEPKPGDVATDAVLTGTSPTSAHATVDAHLAKIQGSAYKESDGGQAFAASIWGLRQALDAAVRACQGVADPALAVVLTALQQQVIDPGNRWGEGVLDSQPFTSACPQYPVTSRSRYKCNTFVAEVLFLALGRVFISGFEDEETGRFFPYRASQWADPLRPIPDAEIPTDPAWGDVWSVSTHCGIYLGEHAGMPLYISARDRHFAQELALRFAGMDRMWANDVQKLHGVQIKSPPPDGNFRRIRPARRPR